MKSTPARALVLALGVLPVWSRPSSADSLAAKKSSSLPEKHVHAHAVAKKERTEIQVTLELSFHLPSRRGRGSSSHSAAVAFTPDGKRFLAVTSGQELVVYDGTTQELLCRKPLPASNAVSFDARGRRIAYALPGRGLCVVDLTSWTRIARDERLKVDCVAISPKGDRVAVARGKQLEIRQAHWLRLKNRISRGSTITNLAWSPNGRTLACTSLDGRLLIYDVAAKKELVILKKKGPLYAVAFHPRGHQVAYGGRDREVWLYDIPGGVEKRIAAKQPFWITCLGYSPDGQLLAMGDESCDVWLFELATGQQVFHGRHHVECWLTTVGWAPDGETLVFGCRPNARHSNPRRYGPLTKTEARQTPKVRKARATLLRTLEGEMKSGRPVRKTLLAGVYRELLRDQIGTVDEVPLPPVAGAPPPAPAVDGAERRSRRDRGLSRHATTVLMLLKEYEAALANEIRRLRDGFSCHQWRVRRPERGRKGAR